MNHFERTRTISITSGKGGVGKTTLVCNLACALAEKNHRVLILDGDLGMANVDIMFGLRSPRNLADVMAGRCEVKDILFEVAPNIHLISGGSGVYDLRTLAPYQRLLLLDQISQLNMNFDYLLIDTAPGIDDSVLYLNSAAQEILVVVTADPTSLTDAYALIKVLHQQHRESHFSVVVNMARNEQEARFVFQKLSDVASRFLCVGLDYKGFIPNDLILRQATREQRLLMQMKNQCPASTAIRALSEKLRRSVPHHELKGGLQFFWNQLSGVA